MGSAASTNNKNNKPPERRRVVVIDSRRIEQDEHRSDDRKNNDMNVDDARGETWPCANCHSTVSSRDKKCPACGGILVKISQEAAAADERIAARILRVKSPATPRETPTKEITLKSERRELGEIFPSLKERRNDDDDDDDGCEDEKEDDEEDDAEVVDDLEASPKHDIIVEMDDGLRPIDPVGQLLGTIPSPIPSLPSKLDANSASAVVAAMLKSDSPIIENKRPLQPGRKSMSPKRELEAVNLNKEDPTAVCKKLKTVVAE